GRSAESIAARSNGAMLRSVIGPAPRLASPAGSPAAGPRATGAIGRSARAHAAPSALRALTARSGAAPVALARGASALGVASGFAVAPDAAQTGLARSVRRGVPGSLPAGGQATTSAEMQGRPAAAPWMSLVTLRGAALRVPVG